MRPSPRGALVVLALAAAVSATAPPAQAQEPQRRLVTIAARSCPSYEAITANRARNNIMESLEDLGPDTTYGVDGVPLLVDPAREASVQPACTAIANWDFTLGTGIESRAVTGVWGALSKVTGPFSPTITTAASVPLLDGAGAAIPGASIGGAVTIELTGQQRELAMSPSKLWIQGGTPTLPITDPVTYGFGALRCATDNLNGDNVEWISYPPDTVHVFCFAYYVKPAPTSGTIRVVKQAQLPAGATPQRVRFTGDVSYNPGGEFFLTASTANPASQSFIRAAGQTWTIVEDEQPLGQLTAVQCTSANGTSVSVADLDARTARVTLGAGDTVTCTYANEYRLPPAGLALRKVTLGAVGTFGFALDGPGGDIPSATVTTTEQGIGALVQPAEAIADLPPDTYTVTERPPPDRGGTWRLERVFCEPGGVRPVDGWRTEIEVVPGTGCSFTNRFTPAGAITLRKITLGDTATTRFQVRAGFGSPRPEYEQTATTTAAGDTVTATGDDLVRLPIGTYAIQETIGGDSRWEVAAVACDGRPIPSFGGRIEITLTDADPQRDCTFANRRIEPLTPVVPEPPAGPTGPPVEVGPEGGIAGQDIAAPVADLAVTKRVRPARVRLGGRLRYLVTVVNRGPDAADDVTLNELGDSARAGALPLRTDDGSCRVRPPRFCRFGTLEPGERATLRVTLRARRTGRFVNRVAVHSSTAQRTAVRKRARAVAFVTRLPPRFTG